MNWKRPISHLAFVVPGALLMALSAFGAVAALLTVRPISSLIDQLYFKASVLGMVVSIFIFYRTKLGTALFFALIIPYGYYTYWFIERFGFRGSLISQAVIFFYVLIFNGRGQIRYHTSQ